MKKFSEIFCDMDEVLADFIGAACKAHGVTRQHLEKKRKPGDWNVNEALGIGNEEFWRPINGLGERFWTKIEPLPWCTTFYAKLFNYADNVIVLSSPSEHPGCYSGKYTWIRKILGPKVKFCPFSEKQLFSKAGRILIDDRELNLSKWVDVEDSGDVILFPSQGNRLHSLAEFPTDYVYNKLERMLKEASSSNAPTFPFPRD